MEEIFRVSILHIKSHPGPVTKDLTLNSPAGNRTRDPANLVQC